MLPANIDYNRVLLVDGVKFNVDDSISAMSASCSVGLIDVLCYFVLLFSSATSAVHTVTFSFMLLLLMSLVF